MTSGIASVKLPCVQDAISLDVGVDRRRWRLRALARAVAPTALEWALAATSSILLILSFPDFDLWPLAWVGLVPLLIAIVRRPRAPQAFMLGWVAGTIFFYGSCYWLTYPMIHYGQISPWLAYPLLAPATLIAGLFPAACCLALAVLSARWGARALALAPFLWVAQEWARLGLIGQLWNALGYSQAYIPSLIQIARVGGVYAVGFLILTVNAAVAYALLQRNVRAAAVAGGALAFVAAMLLYAGQPVNRPSPAASAPSAVVIAVQPNVIPDFERSTTETAALVRRHLSMSEEALRRWEHARPTDHSADLAADDAETKSEILHTRRALARVIIWPESPMNFTYARSEEFRATVANFTRANRAALLFNSLEPADAGGAYNSAVMVNEEGRLIAQYDKIRLMPFGEYVPLPRWLPGSGLVRAIVGAYTPGERYPLIPLGSDARAARAGVFICLESAFPFIARRFTAEGADVLVNITNDAYQGRTAVMRQHLANAIFRAVENDRHVLRVTNTGITALISPRGQILDATNSFEADARAWTVGRATSGRTFYVKHGDIFALACAVLSALALTLVGFSRFRRSVSGRRNSS